MTASQALSNIQNNPCRTEILPGEVPDHSVATDESCEVTNGIRPGCLNHMDCCSLNFPDDDNSDDKETYAELCKLRHYSPL